MWPDRVGDASDPGWRGSWDRYFGKRPAADEESFFVMDDDYYDSFGYEPDANCPNRHGLGLKIEARGFQWANPQAGNVIFWHYDITNESTTDYDDNIIFGLYMDSGVGGSAFSCEGVAESDDDNASFDRSLGLNLVYTFDKGGKGVDLAGTCSPTGYLGYAYLETPGNHYDGKDNDSDGITDELRDGGPGQRILGQDAIRAYLATLPGFDLAAFERFYGPLEQRPAFKVGVWWTGDEDMDWVEEFDDVGGDGVYGSADPVADGERDGKPTEGEPNFDRTDINESDQIGLTGFKMNRIKAGVGSPSDQVDDIVFFTNQYAWPESLYTLFSSADSTKRFGASVVQNYNIGFLFASGPFKLPAGKRERFSLALAYGADLSELRQNVHVVQRIYDANYQFATPPPRPTLHTETVDIRPDRPNAGVRLSWDDVAERGFDPVTGLNDFEGYRIYRSTDPEFQDPRVLTSGRGNPFPSNGKPIAQFDLADGARGYSRTAVDGVSYWLGVDSGIRHTWTDTTVTNGQTYYYAVCSYDYGSPPSTPDSLAFYPSENSIPVSLTPRGGLILPSNVVTVVPEPHVHGYLPASTGNAQRLTGSGNGSVSIEVVQSDKVPNDHLMKVAFLAPAPDSIHATSYALIDSTSGDTLFVNGHDFDGTGSGPVAEGLLAVVSTPPAVLVDESRSGFRRTARTDAVIRAKYVGNSTAFGKSANLRRSGYPEDLMVVFYDTVADTGQTIRPFTAKPAKFKLFARNGAGYRPMDFTFEDDTTGANEDSTLANEGDLAFALDDSQPRPNVFDYTFQFFVGPEGTRKPGAGDTLDIRLLVPFGPSDAFVFQTTGSRVDAAVAKASPPQPYVVPNPYVGSASFEPKRFAVSGRGDRRMEFRNIPLGGSVRIYTVSGDLVRTLTQDGSVAGYVAWDLRTKDNLDVAPGLYLYQVSAPGVSSSIGKFAVIK